MTDLSTSVPSSWTTVISSSPCSAPAATSAGEAHASMNRNVVEQGLLVRMEKVVAPLDERPECGTARIGRRPIVEELQAPPDECEELREPEHVDPRGGELDREREAVDESADLRGEPGVLVRQLEARARRARTRGEELHGRSGDASLVPASGSPSGLTMTRTSPRHGAPRGLSRGPARPGTQRGVPSDAGGLLEDVLARVEDEDRVGVAKARDGARERVGAAYVEGLGDEADDVGALAGWRDRHATRLPELALERTGHLEREPALADPRRPSASRGDAPGGARPPARAPPRGR